MSQNNDTIYRQAAIDAAKDWYEGLICGSFRGLEKRLKSLPSAQPEIIYCKDCMYTDGDKPIADGRYWCMLHGTFMYYCSDAERGSDETNRRRQATGR